jgi:putative endonuclease
MISKPLKHKQIIGKKGEDLTGKFFSDQGYTVVDRNYHTPYGELDLVIRDTHDLIFVEVKTRTNLAFGYGETAISDGKLTHLVESAEYYLAQNNLQDEKWRIDVVAILLDQDGSIANLEWFENVA